MSCDHELIAAHVCDYIDNTANAELRARCELVLQNCAQCRAIVERALAFQNMANNWQEQSVPDWQRARFAVPVPKPASNWLSWSALATSCFALCLVVLQVDISTANGLTISFGHAQQEARFQQMLATELASYKTAQDELLQEQFAAFAEQQETSTLLNLAQAMDQNRAERRQELGFVLSDFESRRLTEQQAVVRQLNELAENQSEDNQNLNVLMRFVSTARDL
jgi:hypothetical protein